MSTQRMPFGKYRGRLLTDLPDAYLDWLLGLDDLREPLASAVCDEAERRHGLTAPISVDVGAAEELIGAGVRTLARRYHPDIGGDHETMARVNGAAEWLRRQLRALA